MAARAQMLMTGLDEAGRWLAQDAGPSTLAWMALHPGPSVTIGIGLMTGVIAILGFLVAAQINLKNKTADCVMHCNLRYDALYSEKSRLAADYFATADDPARRAGVEEQMRYYYNRFWGLKSDQFDYWLSGFIDPETMCGYFFSVLRSFQKDGPDIDPDHPFSNASFRRRWFEGQNHHRATDPIFNGLIERLADLGEQLDRDIARKKGPGTRDPYRVAYESLIRKLKYIERAHADTIKFMVNVTPRSIARRSRMASYLRMRHNSGH